MTDNGRHVGAHPTYQFLLMIDLFHTNKSAAHDKEIEFDMCVNAERWAGNTLLN